MPYMAKKKSENSKPDTHKQKNIFLLRLNDAMMEALDSLVTRQGSDRSTECRIAIREYLERYGYWPPKPKEPDKT